MGIKKWAALGCSLLMISLVGCSVQVSTQSYTAALTTWSSGLTKLGKDFHASDAFTTAGADRIVNEYQTVLSGLKAIKPPGNWLRLMRLLLPSWRLARAS